MDEIARGRELVVGVLGGLGPAATIDFMQKVLLATPAARDQDHLHLMVDSCPKVPNRNEAIAGTGPSSGPALAAMARRLEAAGADFLVMPCNTASYWSREIQAAASVPLINIVDETVRVVARRVAVGTSVGVLAAAGCRAARLYEGAMHSAGLRPVTTDDEEQERFMEVLYAIKGGEIGPCQRSALSDLGERLIARGAETVIAGCTEVPLVLDAASLSRPLVDSTAELAKATVAYARGELALPRASVAA